MSVSIGEGKAVVSDAFNNAVSKTTTTLASPFEVLNGAPTAICAVPSVDGSLVFW